MGSFFQTRRVLTIRLRTTQGTHIRSPMFFKDDPNKEAQKGRQVQRWLNKSRDPRDSIEVRDSIEAVYRGLSFQGSLLIALK